MKLKARNIDLATNFSHYSDRHRLACEELQTKARELLAADPARYEDRHPDILLLAAGEALAPPGASALWPEKFSGIFACEGCGRLYNVDYAENSDPAHDYCSATCQPEKSHKKYDDV